ncbi:MAG: hypothetical protein U9N34_06420, partial [Candidatus Cloacimonadota bacterium]|nr:hypothetical protein [Candidatus Cloacimonadota bacterium]
MKKYILILTVLTLWCSLFSLRNWESYTNTTRIYDALQIDNEIYLATWGGLIVYNTAREEFTKIYTKLDGLNDYDITTLDYIEDRNEILIGTRKGGVNRMVNGEFILALSPDLGLQSPRVNKIINFENKIFVATDKGLSVFAINNDFPFPSLIGNYHDNNGFANDNIWDMTILDNDYLILACDKYITSVHTDSLYLQSAWQNFEENFDRASGITNFGNRVVVSTDRGLYQQDYFDINNDWVDLSFNSLSDTIAFKSVYLESENELWASYGKWEDDQFFISNQVDIAVSKVNLTNLDYQDLSKDDFSKSLTYSIKKIDDIVTFLSWGEGFFQNFQGDLLQYKSNSISSNLITKMNVDKNSKLWICDGAISGSQSSVGMRGISQYDGTEWHNFNVDNSDILSNNIFS